jgi:DNA-binding YbaB/EbfC family protein
MFDKAKMVLEAKKLQQQLAKELIEVEAGQGAVKITVNGEQKVQRVELDDEKVDPENLRQLEKWLESAMNQAFKRSQEVAADITKPFMDKMGIGGL